MGDRHLEDSKLLEAGQRGTKEKSSKKTRALVEAGYIVWAWEKP